MIKKCLHLSLTALTLMTTLLCVRLSIAETDLATDALPNKSESTPVPVPTDSVLHLIPEQTLGLIYCPNLLELDNSINTLETELLSEAQASDVSVAILSNIFGSQDVSVAILSNIFGSQFEDLIALEEIFNVSRDFAIVLTRLEPLQFVVLAHLRDPETIKQIIEKVTAEDERMVYKDVTYRNDSEDGKIVTILDDILIFTKQREVCENIIDTYNGTIQAITKNPDYVSFLTDISEDKDQLAVYFDIETAIATLDRPLEEELQVVIDKLEDADEDDDIAPFFEGISEKVSAFIKQTRFASVRLEMEGADFQIKPFLKFSSDSEFLGVLKEGSNELAFLSELPNRAFVNAAFQGSPKFLAETSKLWFSFFPEKTAEERAQREALLEETKNFYESLADRWSCCVNVGKPAVPVFIYELKDEARAKIYMDEVFLEKLSWTEAYPGQAILHNRVAIQSYVFPNFKADLPEAGQENPDLVPPEWHWYYAFTEGQLLFTTGTSPEAMQIVLDRRAGSKQRFADHPSYQKLIPKLGTDNNVLLAVSPIIAVKTLLPSLDEIDPENPLAIFAIQSSGLLMTLPDNYSVGLAAKAENNGIDAKLFINLGDFGQLVQTFVMIAQMIQY
ncbi:MAG: hypothetical protein OXU51_26280 [Candidatus Poribacteria bacterium]|nr:hypothetical protein [Candidatus Poribacteria bacterium]